MCDEEAISFAEFVLDRFVGTLPEKKMLEYALSDWRRKMNSDDN